MPLTQKIVASRDKNPKVAKFKDVSEGKRSASPPEKETMAQKRLTFDQVTEQESSSL